MSIHASIATKVLTQQFYRTNAMFFLVVIGFCFGFMRGAEHMALASYFVSSPWLVMVPVGVWLFYTIKIILFNSREVRLSENVFLTTLPLLPFYTNAYVCLVVAWGQLAPATAYALFLLLLALKFKQFTIVAIVVAAISIFTIAIAWRIHRSLLYPEREKTTAAPVRWFDLRVTKPMPWMFIEGIVRTTPGLIYTTKIVACLVIYAATQLYVYEDYDARLYSMAACVAFASNLALVYQYQRFEVVHFILLRNLPIKFIRRISSLIITMLVLCFPEIAMLATNLPRILQIQHYFYAVIFGFSLMILAYGFLYVRDALFEGFTRWIFFLTMGWMFLILFSVPLIAGAAIHMAIGMFLLAKNFYSFELKSQP